MAKAKEVLHLIPDDALKGIQSKQVARMVLAEEVEYVKLLVEEGLVSQVHAEHFMEEISRDAERIEAERNRFYKYVVAVVVKR